MKTRMAMVWLAGLLGGGSAWCGGPGITAEPGGGFRIPENPGVLVDDPDAKWLQYLKIGAYAHLQSAVVSGRADGRDFDYTRGSDWRRARLTFNATMLDTLKFVVHANMVEDEGRSGGGVEFDYFGLFLAWAELDLTKLAGTTALDRLSLFYGKRKLTELNEEVETSINSILTIERSSFAGQVVPFRAATGTTGAWLRAGKGRHDVSLGLFTTDSSPEWGDWDEGTVVVGGWKYDLSELLGVDAAVLSLGGAVQDIKGNDERYAVWKWLVTPWLRIRNDRWGLRISAAAGRNDGPDTTTGGDFYGLTVMPVYWLIEDRLQGVLRYQVMASEAPRGVGMAARYAREAGLPANEDLPSLARGTGDLLQSAYAGVVWTLVPKRCTMLGGVEWERLESRDARVYSGVTGWFATRVMF